MNGLIRVDAARPGATFFNHPSFYQEKKNFAPPMRGPINAFKKNNNELEDIVYDNIQPVVMVVRAMGALPIMRPQIGRCSLIQALKRKNSNTHNFISFDITFTGITKFKLASNTMIYSVLIYAALTTHLLYVVWNRIKVVQRVQGRFEEAVIAYLFIVYLLPNFLVPIFWFETRKHVNCYNHWMDFQACSHRRVQRIIL